ncbi:MAG: GAF domain-containing protein [Tabrizicola sp.]|jgi:GAF domain-containing protein|uniref:GAF domain-containing protein n=1 Tax=Tabrizicola sp. TaxID=2005166 RepID=UPI001B6677B7|nr:GAF domain-containing protein [Tabrizicola sp.]
MTAFEDLHSRCAALGTRLFTVTKLDEERALFARVFTSHPVEYPVSGTKPMEKDGWYDTTIAGKRTFVANTPPEFAKYFFDHALIVSLGLGSCINVPVVDGGRVLGTVNILAEAEHFTPERLAGYEALVARASRALAAALR